MTKYMARKIVMNGRKYDSKAEYERHLHLLAEVKAGIIDNLECQKSFVICEKKGKNKRERKYICDFFYHDSIKDCWIIEDVKGIKTQVYSLKKALILAIYPEYIFREVYKRKGAWDVIDI